MDYWNLLKSHVDAWVSKLLSSGIISTYSATLVICTVIITIGSELLSKRK